MAYQRHNFLNGQYIFIEQTTASIGHRIIARIIDYIILSILVTAISGLTSFISYTSDGMMIGITAFFISIYVLYHPLCEQFMGGSIGKKALGMRVVMQSGEAVSIGSSMLRWLLGYIDDFGVGLIAMFCNNKNMRLGDLAGGTIVIQDKSHKDSITFNESMKRFTYLNPEYVPKYTFASELRWGQISFINHTMVKGPLESCSKQRRKNIEMLAKMIAEKFGVEGINQQNSNKFLRSIIADYNYYTWQDTK